MIRRARWPLLALAIAIAVPSWLLTVPSFSPLDLRGSLTGHDVTWTFVLESPRWLFLEADLSVRSSTNIRPTVVASLNDTVIQRLQPSTLFVGERSRTLIPLSAVRSGENRLRLQIDDDAATTFSVNFRIQNYRGINPRFPRAVITADEAVNEAWRVRGHFARAADLLIALVMCTLSIAAFGSILGRRLGVSAPLLFSVSAAILWACVLYAAATPLHVWLLPETTATLVLAPTLVVGALAIARVRRPQLSRAVLATVVITVSVEVGLRALNWAAPSPIFYSDSYGRYRGRPGAPFLDTHLNSRGFNDVDRDPAKPAGTRRVVAIGDSVTFGVVPRQHNYLKRLEANLNTHWPTEIINLGVPGTGPEDYLAILAEEGMMFAPDLVLVSFFIGNDFEFRTRRLYEYSYAAAFAYFVWRVATSTDITNVAFESTGGEYDDDGATFTEERFLEIEVSRAMIYVDERQVSEAARRAADALGTMRAIANRGGAELLVAIIPDEVQVDRRLQEQVVRAHSAPPESFDFMRPNRAIADELSRAGIEFHDLTPVFQSAPAEGRWYKPRDTHWNIAGNRLAADALLHYLNTRDRTR